jgi:AcrR family transcriptional regulator
MSGLGRLGAVPDGVPRGKGSSGSVVRSDVERNHRALLDAARELLSERPDVPLYEIARRAGVGQATLYRHFPDRMAIVGEIATEVLDEVEAEAAASSPDVAEGLTVLLELVISAMVRSGALLQLIDDEPSSAEQPGTVTYALVRRLLSMFESSFAGAKAAGALRADATPEDVVLVLGMAKGVIMGTAPDKRAAAASRALDLALRGLLARSG